MYNASYAALEGRKNKISISANLGFGDGLECIVTTHNLYLYMESLLNMHAWLEQ